MQVVTALVLLVTCELCLTIRVPVVWDASASEVKQEIKKDNDEQFSVESFESQPQNVNARDEIPIPKQYFQYTAKKPQFAVDIAKFHGVQSPENHYNAYPIKPYTGKARPELGKHKLFDKGNVIQKPLQEFANINEDVSHAVPVSSNYEVFHPYEAETPALQEIYKDPVLSKIRNDLENSKHRLQTYEKKTGEPNIHKDEYLESPEKTDSRFVPHRNIPAPYEIHRPQRRPVYYRTVPKNSHREHYLNQRLKHPWNPYSAKIRPMHYRPVKNQIHQLRQNHALKYDDERNEYPQVQVLENYSSDPKDGYDIYEKGKEKFVQLRNNVDESINKAVKENRPVTYEKLEMQNNDKTSDEEDEDEFVPIKNYAQVRKTETFKHLPRSAALDDAENWDEIRNAPRLREAVKSTKAQTVYSEEGYEDSAYDHAGEQKHASENEGHGGYLKEHELSGGKYKTPSKSTSHEDGGGSAYRDQVVHAEKWKDEQKANKEDTDEEDYSEDEHEKSTEADGYQESVPDDEVHRNKRENDNKNDTNSDSSYQINNTAITSLEHDVEKRNANFKVPELDLNSTFLTEKEILQLSKIKIEPKKDNIKQKYPYYFKRLKTISKNSPLHYAENLALIPKKSKGGTEFYDSRSKFECPEVDDVPNPVPEKLNRDGHPDDSDEEHQNSRNKGDDNFETVKKTPRLKGLGDKIDCFKAKYFGKDPLDSPFFKEEIISNPEPVTLPNITPFKLKTPFRIDQHKSESRFDSAYNISDVHNNENIGGLFDLIEKLRSEQTDKRESLIKTDHELDSPLAEIKKTNQTDNHSLNQQSNVYKDILKNIKNNLNIEFKSANSLLNVTNIEQTYTTETPSKDNVTYRFFQNIEDITQAPHKIRKKRSNSFVYEPYKIIRDGQIQDSKKTTTTGNISPLIRQLQSSRVVDRVSKSNQEPQQLEKHVKRNANTRIYKDINRTDREKSKNAKGSIEPTFVDISLDSRRGEPRYEIRHNNHKSRYTPVENKKSMSVEDYKAQTTEKINSRGETNTQRQSRKRVSTKIPDSENDAQTVAASSNTVRKTMSSTTAKPVQKLLSRDEIATSRDDNDSDEDYEEYDDEEEEEETTTTTTTTLKPSFRRRIRLTSTTEKAPETTETPRLKLVTRFRDYKPEDSSEELEESPEKEDSRTTKTKTSITQEPIETIPKYREKKKKSTKSTLVTDTKKYGDDDDDMRKEEIDALIGVKEDMSEYMPLYEKEQESQSRSKSKNLGKQRNENDSVDEEAVDDEDDVNDDEDGNEDSDDHDDDVDDDDDDDEDEDENEDEEGDSSEPEPEITTPEPTKRTLPVTTEAPTPTTSSRKVRPETKPIITRKKIEIHTELPVNKSTPHVTQYKQDIKEVEIVKEIPSPPKRKLQKNLEALELYKDDNLAKDVNKLGGVEIFKKDIDLKHGPRHGGNYRSLVEPSAPLKEAKIKATKEDAETSQSEFTKHVELDDEVPTNKMHGGNLRSYNDYKAKNRGRSSKLIELTEPPVTLMHGGNLKHRGRNTNARKSQKLIELDDDNEQNDDDPSGDHESFSNSGNSGPMHGGNYRREKLVAEEKPEVTEQPIRNLAKGARRSSAAILNSFVQATPLLTTTPVYILDPSKRMYYYVDT